MTVNKWNIKFQRSSHLSWQPAKETSKQIAVLMSGGVDSSVTAHLLKEQGWDVLGITMKIPVSCNAGKRGCCGADAAFVCNELGIAHYFVDVTEPFEKLIIEPFRRSYANGQTPNPCADCNTFLKFSLVWDFLEQTFGITYLATGHYARISKTGGRAHLGIAKDKSKDQSYFLYGISAEKLDKLVLPLGELTKKKVRSIAAGIDLTVAEKAESMELCFVGEGNYRLALTDEQANRTGDLTDMQGSRIGTHKGIANYTIGQRQGLGFAGGRPLYVGKIDARTNTVALGTREEVCFRIVKAEKVNAMMPGELIAGGQFFGKIRSYGNPRLCGLVDFDGARMTVEFDQPQFAPCPGQRLVLYNSDGSIVAGGTISAETINTG